MKKLKKLITLFTLMLAFIAVSATMFASGSASAQSKTHKVKSGETFWGIANAYQISVTELAKANPQIKNTSSITVGQSINIPEANSLSSLENEVAALVNKERAKVGLGALKINYTAAKCARLKSQDMINKKYFSHTSPTYGSPFKMMESFGLKYSSAAENIAYGQKSAAEVMKTWMNSAGHKANILSKTVTQIGVGAAKNANGTIYFTQLFLKPL